MHGRFVALVFIVLSLATPAFAQSAPTLRDINSINGFYEAVEELEHSFRTSLDQFPGEKPAELVEAWKASQEDAFKADRMIAETEAMIAEQLKPEQIATLLEYFKSDFGRRISQLEIAATRPDVQKAKDTEGAAIYAGLATKDPERLALYDSLIADLQSVEVGEAIAVNMAYAMISAMLGSAKQPATDEQIDAIVKQNTASLRSHIESGTKSATAWTYRDVSLEDMRKYVAFIQTPEAKRYYQATLIAFDRVISAEARAFGNKLMIALGQRKA